MFYKVPTECELNEFVLVSNIGVQFIVSDLFPAFNRFTGHPRSKQPCAQNQKGKYEGRLDKCS